MNVSHFVFIESISELNALLRAALNFLRCSVVKYLYFAFCALSLTRRVRILRNKKTVLSSCELSTAQTLCTSILT